MCIWSGERCKVQLLSSRLARGNRPRNLGQAARTAKVSCGSTPCRVSGGGCAHEASHLAEPKELGPLGTFLAAP